MKAEIKAQVDIIAGQSRDIDELASKNEDLHEEVRSLKEEIEDLKESIQTHGESLRRLDGNLSSIIYAYGDLFPSFN